MAAARVGEGYDTFLRQFEAEQISPVVLHVVYHLLQESLANIVPAFPVRGSDNLIRVYGIAPDAAGDDDDFNDLLRVILTRCDRLVPTDDITCQLQTTETVSDLIRFINQCPRKTDLPT